jgi:hypothetical protein
MSGSRFSEKVTRQQMKSSHISISLNRDVLK